MKSELLMVVDRRGDEDNSQGSSFRCDVVFYRKIRSFNDRGSGRINRLQKVNPLQANS